MPVGSWITAATVKFAGHLDRAEGQRGAHPQVPGGGDAGGHGHRRPEDGIQAAGGGRDRDARARPPRRAPVAPARSEPTRPPAAEVDHTWCEERGPRWGAPRHGGQPVALTDGERSAAPRGVGPRRRGGPPSRRLGGACTDRAKMAIVVTMVSPS